MQECIPKADLKASNNEIINSVFGGEGMVVHFSVTPQMENYPIIPLPFRTTNQRFVESNQSINAATAFIQRLCKEHLGQLNLHHPDNNYFISAKERQVGTLKLFLLYKCF